jgi:hypothetical protein
MVSNIFSNKTITVSVLWLTNWPIFFISDLLSTIRNPDNYSTTLAESNLIEPHMISSDGMYIITISPIFNFLFKQNYLYFANFCKNSVGEC